MNTLHIDITYFCNYHCEYCYQGTEKHPTHISDRIYDNLVVYLNRIKTPTNVVLIGGEPFMYPRFFELCEKIVTLGHYVTVATNFSMPMPVLKKFLVLTQGRLLKFKISLHLTQIKNFDRFTEKLVILRTMLEELETSPEIISVGCVVTDKNFAEVKNAEEKLKAFGFNLLYQRIFDENGYCRYGDEVEEYVKKNKCIDIDVKLLTERNLEVYGKSCSCGNDFYKILLDGTVTRCFSEQEDGFNVMGNMNRSAKIRRFAADMPCLAKGKTCRCHFHFVKDGQLKPGKRGSRFAYRRELVKNKMVGLFKKGFKSYEDKNHKVYFILGLKLKFKR